MSLGGWLLMAGVLAGFGFFVLVPGLREAHRLWNDEVERIDRTYPAMNKRQGRKGS